MYCVLHAPRLLDDCRSLAMASGFWAEYEMNAAVCTLARHRQLLASPSKACDNAMFQAERFHTEVTTCLNSTESFPLSRTRCLVVHTAHAPLAGSRAWRPISAAATPCVKQPSKVALFRLVISWTSARIYMQTGGPAPHLAGGLCALLPTVWHTPQHCCVHTYLWRTSSILCRLMFAETWPEVYGGSYTPAHMPCTDVR